MQSGATLRFSFYKDRFEQLKEINAASEIMERELIRECIKANIESISDISDTLLELSSVINLVCLRSFKYCKYQYVQNIIQGFISDISRYSNMKQNEDEDEEDFADKMKAAEQHLSNSEALLVKCLQAVIRVKAMTLNSFRETIEDIYSKHGADSYDEICGRLEFSSNFWRTIIEKFIKEEINKAYNKLINKSKYSYSRANKLVSIHFYFDNVLEEIRRETLKKRQKRKHLYYVETDVQEFEYKRIRQVVYDFLQENMEVFLDDSATLKDLNYIIEIVCFDKAAAEYKRLAIDEVLHKMQWEEMQSKMRGTMADKTDLDYVTEQLLSCALGAAMAYFTIKEDFFNAINVFSTKNMQIFEYDDVQKIQKLTQYFEPTSLSTAFEFMLENYFANLLKRKCMDKKEKIEVKSIHKRRITEDDLEELYEWGLTRIKKNKLFQADNTHPEMFEYKYNDLAANVKAFDILQMEDYLRDKYLDVWENATFKVEFFVDIKLDMIAKSTPDLKKGLSEILYKYGIITG